MNDTSNKGGPPPWFAIAAPLLLLALALACYALAPQYFLGKVNGMQVQLSVEINLGELIAAFLVGAASLLAALTYAYRRSSSGQGESGNTGPGAPKPEPPDTRALRLAQAFIESAKREAEEIREKATKDATAIVTDAQGKADQIESAAQRKAEEINRAAQGASAAAIGKTLADNAPKRPGSTEASKKNQPGSA